MGSSKGPTSDFAVSKQSWLSVLWEEMKEMKQGYGSTNINSKDWVVVGQ
jgi:hypothetical protein